MLDDSTKDDLTTHLDNAMHFIRAAKERAQRILVHCKMGMR